MSNGYLVVASRKESFYRLAINCLESLKDYYPDARCCLVTEERFLDGREYVADDLIFAVVMFVKNYGVCHKVLTILPCT